MAILKLIEPYLKVKNLSFGSSVVSVHVSQKQFQKAHTVLKPKIVLLLRKTLSFLVCFKLMCTTAYRQHTDRQLVRL